MHVASLPPLGSFRAAAAQRPLPTPGPTSSASDAGCITPQRVMQVASFRGPRPPPPRVGPFWRSSRRPRPVHWPSPRRRGAACRRRRGARTGPANASRRPWATTVGLPRIGPKEEARVIVQDREPRGVDGIDVDQKSGSVHDPLLAARGRRGCSVTGAGPTENTRAMAPSPLVDQISCLAFTPFLIPRGATKSAVDISQRSTSPLIRKRGAAPTASSGLSSGQSRRTEAPSRKAWGTNPWNRYLFFPTYV